MRKFHWPTAAPPDIVHEPDPVRAPDGRELFPCIDFNLFHRLPSAIAYAIFLLFCNLALPCICYYVLKDHTSLSEHALIGIGSAALGVSSSFDAPFRTYKLIRYRSYYGPIGSTKWWQMDFTAHLYTVALLLFAIPLAYAPIVKPTQKVFFLCCTVLLVGPVWLFFVLSLTGIRIPFAISSDPVGTRIKPGFYYLAEDIGAVDFRHGQPFRRQLMLRYASSPPFRRMMLDLTLLWTLGLAIYMGATVAVACTLNFGFAYGFVLGQLFIFLIIWGLLSVVVTYYGKQRELRWWLAHAKANPMDTDASHTLQESDFVSLANVKVEP